MAFYNIRNAHHKTIWVDQKELNDRFEIFDDQKTGVMPMRKRHREFLNHSSCEGFNIVTHEVKQDCKQLPDLTKFKSTIQVAMSSSRADNNKSRNKTIEVKAKTLDATQMLNTYRLRNRQEMQEQSDRVHKRLKQADFAKLKKRADYLRNHP